MSVTSLLCSPRADIWPFYGFLGKRFSLYPGLWILEFWNTSHGSRNPARDCNQESKFHWQRIQNLESIILHSFYRYGGSPFGLSCETQLICTVEEIALSLDNGEETDLIIMDFSKAFDSVPHQRLLMKLRYYGIRGILNTWLTQWLTCRSQSVVVDGYSSPDVPVLSGVPQGTVLGPLLFLLYINDLGENCTSRMRLFADDTLIYSTIESYNDAAKLQSDLTALQEWAQKWQMKFNPSKSHVLRISRKQNPVESNYVLMGKVLNSVTHHPYLGVELSRNLDWGQHVNNKVMKANLSLGFLRRNLSSCPEGVKEAAYKAIVRPHVEYASSVWDRHLKKQVKQIDGVQRRAARFVKNCYTREPGTVTNLLNELNWIPLKERRTISRL